MSRLDTWERRAEWPLMAAAALFLGAYAWPILDEHLVAGWRHACTVVDYTAWLLFAVDYFVRIALTSDRWHYVWHHIPDLAIIALPILRPLRLLRLVMLLRILNRSATATLRGRIATYVVGSTVLLLFCASLAVLSAERHHAGANITSFGDALWWSIVTISTVGYGDRFPVTGEGRLVAAGLMIGGIALLGIVTASLASWLIERIKESEDEAQAVTRADIDRLMAEVAMIKNLLLERGSVHTAAAIHAGRRREDEHHGLPVPQE